MTSPHDSAAWRERLLAVQSQLNDLFPVDEAAAAEEAFAAQARKGAFGREWQVLQGRIDMNLTNREAILSGEDDSAEAHLVRQAGARQADEFIEMLRQNAPDDSRDPGAELRALHAETAERGERINAMLRELSDRDGRI